MICIQDNEFQTIKGKRIICFLIGITMIGRMLQKVLFGNTIHVMDAADGHMILKKEKQPTTTLPHMPFAKQTSVHHIISFIDLQS